MREERGEMMEERCGVLGRDEREGVRDEGCYYLLIDVVSPSHLPSVCIAKYYNLLLDLLSPPLPLDW